MWWRAVLWLIAALLAVAVVIIAAALYGSNRWQSRTEALHEKLAAARSTIAPKTHDPQELDALPQPIQRYFRTVLTNGQPLVAAVEVEHVGEFNVSDLGLRI